jgi:hypothetical protein
MSFAQGHSQENAAEVSKEQVPRGSPTDELLQRQPERQLFIVFFALLQMEKRTELNMISKQAEQLLPVVQEAIALGELSMEKRKMLVSVLNAKQQQFFEELSTQMHNRELNRKPGPPPGPIMTDEERQALAKDIENRRLNESASISSLPPRFGDTPPVDYPMDKNVEQQLVELLESKLEPRG